MNANLNFDMLIEQLPEAELWRLLQDVIDSEIELTDGTIKRLDDRMQGDVTLGCLALALGYVDVVLVDVL